jgi:hypothetical protein
MKLSLAPRSFFASASIVLFAGSAFACKKGPSEAPVVASATSSSTYGTEQLGHFIGSATRAERWHLAAKEVAPPRPGVLEVLDAAQVQALLATFDLKQIPNGPLARCMGKQRYVFFDAQGNKLGSITFDGCGTRFDSADGKVRGGIKAGSVRTGTSLLSAPLEIRRRVFSTRSG